MAKCKIPDSELTEKLRDKQYTSYYAISKAVGLVCNTDLIRRCHRLEELYGIPARIPSRSGRPIENKPKPEPKPKKPKLVKKPGLVRTPEKKPEVIKITPTGFPFHANDQVRYDGRLCTVAYVIQDKITLRRNADLKHITLTMEEYTQNPNILRRIEEKQPIKGIGQAIVTRQSGREYIQDVETAETAKNFEPFDLEMGDNTDKVKDFGPLFSEEDYIDEEWITNKPIISKPTIREKIKKVAVILFGEGKK